MRKILIKFTVQLLLSYVLDDNAFAQDKIQNKESKGTRVISSSSAYILGPLTENEFRKKIMSNKKSQNGTSCRSDIEGFNSFSQAYPTYAQAGNIITNGVVECNFTNHLDNGLDFALLYISIYQCIYTDLDHQGEGVPLCNSKSYVAQAYHNDQFSCSGNGINDIYVRTKLKEGTYLTYTLIDISPEQYDGYNHELSCFDYDYVTVTKDPIH